VSFIPPSNEWVRQHYEDVPAETIAWVGDLDGLDVLDLGCGELLSGFGLVARGVRTLTALDVHDHPADFVDTVHRRLRASGYDVPIEHRRRVAYVGYDGKDMPFPDEAFDLVFCWGVLEHVADVPRVLAESFRVTRTGGQAFLFTYPFWPSYYGSHLTDFIIEPFFHLRHDAGWVRRRLDAHIVDHPDQCELLDHLWDEFCTLNHLGSAEYHAMVAASGFHIAAVDLIAPRQDLSAAPPGYATEDLMICGSRVLLSKPPAQTVVG
jgi:ubiquinone/menaquinone biosynthesis C-methylase UbiE